MLGEKPQAPPDDETLINLYERMHNPIYTYVYRLLGSREDADDITQEVFIKVIAHWDKLSEREQLSSWLYRIATNLSVDILRRRKRAPWWSSGVFSLKKEHQQKDQEPDISTLLSSPGGIPEVAERDLIRMTLDRLPLDYAVVLVLHAAQGIPYQQIADILSVSPQAAATRISRAKKLFIKHYQHFSQDAL